MPAALVLLEGVVVVAARVLVVELVMVMMMTETSLVTHIPSPDRSLSDSTSVQYCAAPSSRWQPEPGCRPVLLLLVRGYVVR